ncbi:hypothetical protein A2311_02780 [candidate division WOR-1 bacterium RIFOXYB2_FULL_48_7]|uniref:Photosynthesis system II assembly factor Ycf48/Hcf136-like domain-containing protein n=1 Tax=candidate division WOR-1 bacterium RIFOXYB2_FULL_48_7 TaxID=1802583 RepID=A0A1F4TP62_UNCSA|nr:MAG: hypothetical protein A2311_02780 [candidate division WOR-1 bacterium RIFOXYB2_FULL_48_7]
MRPVFIVGWALAVAMLGMSIVSCGEVVTSDTTTTTAVTTTTTTTTPAGSTTSTTTSPTTTSGGATTTTTSASTTTTQPSYWSSVNSGTSNTLMGGFFLSGGVYGWLVGDNSTILATINGGQSWLDYGNDAGITLTGVCFHNSREGTVVGASGYIGITSDGGDSWTNKTQPGISNYFNSVAVDDDSTEIIVGNGGKILVSTDGGVNWADRSISGGDYKSVKWDGGNFSIVGSGETVLFGTADASGVYFTRRVYEQTDQPLVAVAAHPGVGGTSIIIGTNEAWTTFDGWATVVASGEFFWMNAAGVAFPGNGKAWVVGGTGKIAGWNGSGWVTEESGTTSALYGVIFPSTQEGWAFGYQGKLLKYSLTN